MNIQISNLMGTTRNENAIVIAELYNVHPSYVRKAVSGKLNPKKKVTVKKIEGIIAAYNQYLKGKNNLIKSIEKHVAV